mgnify:CR=1 FL=1
MLLLIESCTFNKPECSGPVLLPEFRHQVVPYEPDDLLLDPGYEILRWTEEFKALAPGVPFPEAIPAGAGHVFMLERVLEGIDEPILSNLPFLRENILPTGG